MLRDFSGELGISSLNVCPSSLCFFLNNAHGAEDLIPSFSDPYLLLNLQVPLSQ
jgi:hypothetical protein